VYSRSINTGKKKKSKKSSEIIAFGVLTFKKGILLVVKNTLIFLELLSFNLTILKRRKRDQA
jgi:hypothetical protein